MHVPCPTPLLAAGFDWLEGLVPLLFVIFWIISQVVNLIRRVAGAGGRAAPVVPPRPAAPPGDPRADLERRIEEFLRQSRVPREPAPASPAPPRPPERRPAPPRPTRVPPAKGATASRVPPPLPGQPPRLADRHLQPLGEAGDDVAEHVAGAFARDLGHRVPASAPGDAAARSMVRGSTLAADLAPALRDPATLRQLILMREVLDRPVERWE